MFPALPPDDGNEINEAVKKLNNKNIDCAFYTVDITEGDSVCDAVNDIQRKYNTIDVLINSAAFAMKNLTKCC